MNEMEFIISDVENFQVVDFSYIEWQLNVCKENHISLSVTDLRL